MARSSVMGGHVRSASLPCHSHPVVMQVEDQLVALRSWMCNPGQNPLSLAHVRALLCVLDELLLHLPACSDDDTLLDGFLVLADAFGSFLAALLALRQHAAELRAAVRRRDPAKIASAARKQRQLGKELEHLAASLVRAKPATSTMSSDSELEVVRTVADAINGTAVASASVFVEVAAVSDATTTLASSSSTSNKTKQQRLTLVNASSSSDKSKREALALEKLQELDQCIGELETETEKVFRSLVQTRVTLLNIHTPAF